MRWSLWLVLIGLLLASLTRTPPVATAVATGLLTAGYRVRRRFPERLLPHLANRAEPRGDHTPTRRKAATADHDEQRRFQAIVERLETDDSAFVERLRSLTRPRRRTGPTTAVIVFGLVITMTGLLGDPALAVVGALITMTAFRVRALPAAPRPPRACGPDDAGPPPGTGRGAAV